MTKAQVIHKLGTPEVMEFGGYFRMLPVNIRRTVCERGKFDVITGSD